MNDSPYRWVTIQRFWSPTQALFLKSVLEGNEIPVFIRNEHLGGLFAHFTLQKAEGGVELQVPSDCVEAAMEILQGLEDGGEEETSDEADGGWD